MHAASRIKMIIFLVILLALLTMSVVLAIRQPNMIGISAPEDDTACPTDYINELLRAEGVEPTFKSFQDDGTKIRTMCREFFSQPENPVWYGSARWLKKENRLLNIYGMAQESGTLTYKFHAFNNPNLNRDGNQLKDEQININCQQGYCRDFFIRRIATRGK